MSAGASLYADLRALIGGRVHGADDIPVQFCTNYGGFTSARPEAVVEASSEEDIVAVLRYCRARGVPITLRGGGHSSNGRLNLADRGVLLVNAPAATPDMTIGSGVADIGTRACWAGVEEGLNAAGVAARVLPNSLGVGVGGTVAVGGYGVRSIRWGAQVDNIASLRLILPDGTPVEASPEQDGELFRFALAGLGGVGVVERVRLRTMPLPPWTRSYVATSRSWSEMCDALTAVVALRLGETTDDLPMELVASCGPDGFGRLQRRYYFTSRAAAERAATPARPQLGSVSAGPIECRPWFAESHEVDRWLASFGNTHKVWADFVLSEQGFRPFLAEVERRLQARHAGHRHLPWVYLLLLRVPDRHPEGTAPAALALLSPTSRTGEFMVGCGLYHMVPAGDSVGLAAAIDACGELTELCVALGGRPYLHGISPLHPPDLRRVFGADYERLMSLRAKLDPDGIFNTGFFTTS